MKALVNLVLSTIAVVVAAYIIPGVTIEGFFTALVVAVVLGLANALIRPILTILTLPLNIITLGLFSFVITALLIMLTGAIVPGFAVAGFVTALLFGVVLTLVNWAIFSMSGNK